MADYADDAQSDAPRYPSVDTRDILTLARLLRAGKLRVPLSGPEGDTLQTPEGREGGRMYMEPPEIGGYKLPLPRLPSREDIDERPGHHLRGAAQNAFMMMGYGTGGGASGQFTTPAKLFGDPALGAASDAGKAILAHPRIAAALGSIPAMLAATAADTGQGPGPKPVDYEPPSFASEAGRVGLKALDKLFGTGMPGDDQRPLTLEQYKEKNRKFTPKTEADFVKEALDKVQATDEYKNSQSKGYRANRDAAATAEGRANYLSTNKSLDDEDKRLGADYESYRTGWDQQRKEHLAKPFIERNPIAGSLLTYGPIPLSAMLMRGGLGAINSKGAKIATAGEAARLADNTRALADNIVKAEKYAPRAAVGKAALATEAMALPFESRVTMDVGDAFGLPPDAPAAVKAQSRLSDWNQYLSKAEQSLVSGAIGTLGGAGWAKLPQTWWGPFKGAASPGVDLATLRSHARGLGPELPDNASVWERYLPGRRLAPDEMAIGLSERAAAAKEAQGRLKQIGSAQSEPIALVGTDVPAPAPAPPPPVAPPAAPVAIEPPTPVRDRLSNRVRATDQQLQREAVPSPDGRASSAPSSIPQWAIDAGVTPHGNGQFRFPNGKFGYSLDDLNRFDSYEALNRSVAARKAAKTRANANKADAESTAPTKPDKSEQSVNAPEPAPPKEPVQIDDMAPNYYEPRKPKGRGHSSLSEMLRYS